MDEEESDDVAPSDVAADTRIFSEMRFDDANSWALKCSAGERDDLPLRTFHNHRKAISDIFDVSIECDNKDGNKYYIDNPERLEGDNLRSWLIDSYATLNQVQTDKKMEGRIMFENIPSGNIWLTTFIQAMRKSCVVKVTHRGFWNDYENTFDLEPYYLRILKQRWYVIGRNQYYAVRPTYDFYQMLLAQGDLIKVIESTSVRNEMKRFAENILSYYKKQIMSELPKFMQDQSDYDGHAETIMDYVLSWCFRRAQVFCAEEKPKLYEKCRYMLSKILGLTDNQVEYTSVEVWKQWNYIDLVVDVVAIVDGIEQKYAILIENKYYTGLHLKKDTDGESKNQLEVYRKKFDNNYRDSNKYPGWQFRYVVITCIGISDQEKEKYDNFKKTVESFENFTCFSREELLKDIEPTESDIFNEF